jgi:hypothetical protein
MGFLDDAKGKIEDLVGKNPDKVEELSDQGIAKATDLADNATGGKFGEQIDAAGQKADEAIGE